MTMPTDRHCWHLAPIPSAHLELAQSILLASQLQHFSACKFSSQTGAYLALAKATEGQSQSVRPGNRQKNSPATFHLPGRFWGSSTKISTGLNPQLPITGFFPFPDSLPLCFLASHLHSRYIQVCFQDSTSEELEGSQKWHYQDLAQPKAAQVFSWSQSSPKSQLILWITYCVCVC